MLNELFLYVQVLKYQFNDFEFGNKNDDYWSCRIRLNVTDEVEIKLKYENGWNSTRTEISLMRMRLNPLSRRVVNNEKWTPENINSRDFSHEKNSQ